MVEFGFVVWVGGIIVNDFYLSESDANALAMDYRADGYDDVVVEAI